MYKSYKGNTRNSAQAVLKLVELPVQISSLSVGTKVTQAPLSPWK